MNQYFSFLKLSPLKIQDGRHFVGMPYIKYFHFIYICVATAQRLYTVATLEYEENTINKNSTMLFFKLDKTLKNIVDFILYINY